MIRLLFVAVMFFLASCGASRHLQKDERVLHTDSVVEQSSKKDYTGRYIDTTRIDSSRIVITEIVFFPPDSVTEDLPNVELPNIGRLSGVKSITQTVLESKSEKKGESKETNVSEKKDSSTAISRRESEKQIVKESVAQKSDKWKYIFYIILLCSCILLYIKRVPLLNWLKKILSAIRLLFK